MIIKVNKHFIVNVFFSFLFMQNYKGFGEFGHQEQISNDSVAVYDNGHQLENYLNPCVQFLLELSVEEMSGFLNLITLFRDKGVKTPKQKKLYTIVTFILKTYCYWVKEKNIKLPDEIDELIFHKIIYKEKLNELLSQEHRLYLIYSQNPEINRYILFFIRHPEEPPKQSSIKENLQFFYYLIKTTNPIEIFQNPSLLIVVFRTFKILIPCLIQKNSVIIDNEDFIRFKDFRINCMTEEERNLIPINLYNSIFPLLKVVFYEHQTPNIKWNPDEDETIVNPEISTQFLENYPFDDDDEITIDEQKLNEDLIQGSQELLNNDPIEQETNLAFYTYKAKDSQEAIVEDEADHFIKDINKVLELKEPENDKISKQIKTHLKLVLNQIENLKNGINNTYMILRYPDNQFQTNKATRKSAHGVI